MKHRLTNKTINRNYFFFSLIPMFAVMILGCSKGNAAVDEGNKNQTVSVTEIKITPTTMTTYRDVKQQLAVEIVPSNATNKVISWRSSDPLVAIVSPTGLVSGVRPGTTVITATTLDGNKTASCTVTVPPLTTIWPDSLNTGLPSGTVLTPGLQRTITVDNTIVEGERIIATTFTQYCGGLTIKAKNVIVRNCWITSSFGTGETVNGTGVIKVLAGATVTIEHCLLDGDNRTHAGIWYEGASVTAKANNIYKVNDGIFVWYANNFDFEDNYVHNLTDQSANGHIDGFQTEGSMHGILRHNAILITQGQNACVNIYAGNGNTDDILVENNLLAGGGFTAYAFDDSPSAASPSGGFSTTNIRFIYNTFTRVYYPYVGYYGVWFPRGRTTDECVRLGNYVLETMENIDAKQPAGCTEAFP
jgi:uncharacterized protein YjdB